jgi:hypothetical protein
MGEINRFSERAIGLFGAAGTPVSRSSRANRCYGGTSPPSPARAAQSGSTPGDSLLVLPVVYLVLMYLTLTSQE